MLQSWLDGSRPVESRLFIDVRDVALAHYRASQSPVVVGRRYILSHERRIPASLLKSYLTEAIREICCRRDVLEKTKSELSDCITKLWCDDKFDGGSITVSVREVDASHLMRTDLGIECRGVKEIVRDAVYSLYTVSDSITVT